MTYTWAEREAVLAEVAAAPYERAALEAAQRKLRDLLKQYPEDLDIRALGEVTTLELLGLDYEEGRAAPGSPTGPRRGP